MRLAQLGTMFVVGFSSITACGCKDYEGRQAVSGTVVFQGNPLGRGMIEFEPTYQETPKSASSAVIVRGEYAIPRKHGLFPGTYRVRIISAYDPDDPANAVPPGEEKGPGEGSPPPRSTKKRIPAQYNLQTTLQAEVAKGGKNVFDYDLKD